MELVVVDESPLRKVYDAITHPNGHYGDWDEEGFRFNFEDGDGNPVAFPVRLISDTIVEAYGVERSEGTG